IFDAPAYHDITYFVQIHRKYISNTSVEGNHSLKRKLNLHYHKDYRKLETFRPQIPFGSCTLQEFGDMHQQIRNCASHTETRHMRSRKMQQLNLSSIIPFGNCTLQEFGDMHQQIRNCASHTETRHMRNRKMQHLNLSSIKAFFVELEVPIAISNVLESSKFPFGNCTLQEFGDMHQQIRNCASHTETRHVRSRKMQQLNLSSIKAFLVELEVAMAGSNALQSRQPFQRCIKLDYHFSSNRHREVIGGLIDISNAHSFDVTSSNVQPEISKLSTSTLQLEMNTPTPVEFTQADFKKIAFSEQGNKNTTEIHKIQIVTATSY
ncbi:hypothetical protein P5673_004089, partial [Acropora cervicornis]